MSVHRLLNRILCDEERANHIEASLNVHLQNNVKNVGRIQDDFSRVVEKINTCDDRVDVHQQRHVDQESFNRAILERMQEMEATIEGQAERIVSLEEEVATLRWRKACVCGEEGKQPVIATGSGEDESLELEYAEEEEGGGLGSSYHSPIVAQEEVPLLVFGKVLPGDTQSLPVKVQETCGCPVPAFIRIEDDVEMVAAPRENNTPIPVWVNELPSSSVRTPRASRGQCVLRVLLVVSAYSACFSWQVQGLLPLIYSSCQLSRYATWVSSLSIAPRVLHGSRSPIPMHKRTPCRRTPS